jgi:hypothetical protein
MSPVRTAKTLAGGGDTARFTEILFRQGIAPVSYKTGFLPCQQILSPKKCGNAVENRGVRAVRRAYLAVEFLG